jgi:ABC-type nickel/cobalt efflux system permease component RcnA
MQQDIGILSLTAASIGFIHTLAGPDHFVPFIALAKARGWTAARTLFITFLCGAGHVLGSVILGLAGIGLGVMVGRLSWIESMRGEIAAWLLIGFGLAYLVWGVKKAYEKKEHGHTHVHEDGESHTHIHSHAEGHRHFHNLDGKKQVTPWILFIIFVLGPCEPLIPILMVPAAKHSWTGLLLVTLIFGIVTIGTMMGIVALACRALKFLRPGGIGKYSHALAGLILLLSGLAIRFLGL